MKYKREYLDYVELCVENNSMNMDYKSWELFHKSSLGLDAKILDTTASVRLLNRLNDYFRNNGKSIYEATVRDLVDIPSDELFNIQGFGRRTMKEVQELINQHSFGN